MGQQQLDGPHRKEQTWLTCSSPSYLLCPLPPHLCLPQLFSTCLWLLCHCLGTSVAVCLFLLPLKLHLLLILSLPICPCHALITGFPQPLWFGETWVAGMDRCCLTSFSRCACLFRLAWFFSSSLFSVEGGRNWPCSPTPLLPACPPNLPTPSPP